MKKIISILFIAIFAIGSSFAFDMTIGLKGLAGSENSGIDGCSIGGGFDVNLDLYKGFGLQIESNIATNTITSVEGGVTFENNMVVQIPVMAWYNAKFNWLGFGLGAGLSCAISENNPENSSNMKLGLAAGAKIKFFVAENIVICLGTSGNLDCFPTLVKTTNGNSNKFNLEKTDLSRNAIYFSIGVEYKIL